MNDTNTELKRFFIATMAILAWSVLTSLSLFSATILAHDFSFALFIQPLFLILTAVLFLSTFSSNFFPVNLHFYEDATSIDNLIFPIIGAFLSIGLAHFPIITIATVCVATVATVFAGAFSVGIEVWQSQFQGFSAEEIMRGVFNDPDAKPAAPLNNDQVPGNNEHSPAPK